jgi:hypothetical protein
MRENRAVDGQTPTDARPPFELSGRQRDLAEALSKKDPRLAAMYLGALTVVEGSGNPDALAQACHSLRELMEKVPTWYASVPAPEQLPRMGDKVSALEGRWERMRQNTVCLNDGNWGGEIDGHLGAWLQDAEEFFAWRQADRPEHNKRTAEMFRKLDPMGLPLPTAIGDRRLQEWGACRQYFVDVSHHRSAVAPEEVTRRVSVMEDILLDLIRPTTFKKHADIDAIVEMGERDADD